jgi:hypothetical protein
MLILFEFLGRGFLCILIGSWANTAVPRARNFALGAGSLVLGFALGLIFYLCQQFLPGQIDRLDAFVGVPAAILVLTFVIEGIRKEIQKNNGQVAL